MKDTSADGRFVDGGRRAQVSGRTMRPLVVAGALLSAGVVAAATLLPSPEQSPLPRWELCLACGDLGGANAVLNVALFTPLGATLLWLGLRPRHIVLVGVLLSLFIEVAQVWIPGRHSTLGDVACNALGVALGASLASHLPAMLWPTNSRRRWLELAAGVAASAAVAATALLFAFSPTDDVYYGQWTPRLEHLEPYEGRVLSASVGGTPVPSSRLTNGPLLAGAFEAGAPVAVAAVAGPRPSRIASLFSIYDAHRRQILLLGVDRADVVLRHRRRASAARLAEPEARWQGVLSGVEAGDTVRLSARRDGPAACLTLNGNERCVPGASTADGWILTVGADLFRGPGPAFPRTVWLWVFALPLGLWFALDGLSIFALSLVGASVAGTAAAGALSLPPAGQLISAVTAFGVGVYLQRLLRRRRPAGASPATGNERLDDGNAAGWPEEVRKPGPGSRRARGVAPENRHEAAGDARHSG